VLPVLLPSRMQEADRRTIEAGVPSVVLMERAGHAVAFSALRLLGKAYGRRILVLAGKGNNGGDALVVARKLHRMGALVRIAMTQPPRSLEGDPLVMYERLVPLGIPVGTPAPEIIEKVAANSDLVIDGLFGTGFKGAASGIVGEWIEAANRSGTAILAIDIPSGLDGATGSVRGPVIKAIKTVALQALKCGHLLGEGPKVCGDLEIADLGIAVTDADATAFVSEAADVADMVPRRPVDAHKWSSGSVLVVGGSRGMTGAAIMTAKAALKAGAGIVMLAIPRSVQQHVVPTVPELLTLALEETSEGALSEDAFESIAAAASRYRILALGPGLGREPSTGRLVRRLLGELDNPAVVDADALNLLGTDAYKVVGEREAPTVITPHPAEMARMLASDPKVVDRERLSVATEVAAKWQCVVILKGHRSVVAGPEGIPVVNVTGGPELATAGTGDVLTGIVAALLSAGATPMGAAIAGAWLHGKAGRLAGDSTRGHGVTAPAVIEHVPEALAILEDHAGNGGASVATGVTTGLATESRQVLGPIRGIS
jgi:hydroxyethylthiazole kinase-like uncharacterized protein yjeF